MDIREMIFMYKTLLFTLLTIVAAYSLVRFQVLILKKREGAIAKQAQRKSRAEDVI